MMPSARCQILMCLLALFYVPLAGAMEVRCQDISDPKVFKEPIEVIASRLLREAGARILKLRDVNDFQIQQKKNFADLKTKGDCTSQNYIFEYITKTFPDHSLLGEEKCAESKPQLATKLNGFTWILDPIDGTTNYAHGMPHFAISLALTAGNSICFGAIYAPLYDEFFYATRGKGAFLSTSARKAEPIHVSQIDKLKGSLWITGTEGGPSAKAVSKNVKTFTIAREIIEQSHDMRRTGSAALDLASVASGRAEGYWELGEGLNWWDISAGLLLIEEAGGKVDLFEPRAKAAAEVHLKRPIVAVVATNGQAEIRNTIISLVKLQLKDSSP